MNRLLILVMVLLTLGCTGSAPDAVTDEAAIEDASPEPTPEPSPEPIVYEKVEAEDPFFDANGDGYQDIIISKYRVHRDLDHDGKFDYTLKFKFTEIDADGHREFMESGYDRDLYQDLAQAGYDGLCFESQQKVQWFIDNYRNFSYYHDWYSYLGIFSESEVNDHRITQVKEKGEYDYEVYFNPDGTISTIFHDGETTTLSEWNEETKEAEGEQVMLSITSIEDMEDLNAVKAEIEGLLA